MADLTAAGLEEIFPHFLPQRFPWCQDRRTWSMVQLGMEVRSRTDYILGTDYCLFRNVAIRDPQHNSDHYLVLVLLRSAPQGNTLSILGGAHGSPSGPQPPQQGRTDSSWPYIGPSPSLSPRRLERTCVSQHTHGGLSMRESQCARIPHKTRPTSGN